MAEKTSSGQPSRQAPIYNAAFVNDLVDMVAEWKQGRAGGQSTNFTPTPTDVVKVKNLTGGNRKRGEVVQLGLHLLNEFDPRNLRFEGNSVSSSTTPKYAILQRPLPASETGPAQVSGICLAQVVVSKLSHTHGLPVAGAHVLQSAWNGPLEFMSPITAIGLQDVAVKFGTPRLILRGVTTEDLAPGSACGVAIWAINPETGVDGPTGQTENAKDWLLSEGDTPILEGAKVVIEYFIDSRRWYVVEVTCPG